MPKILIADDIEQNRYMLQVLLRGYNYEVISATNGAEALESARLDPPNMIVTDILMPVMDGFTLCRYWKEDEQLKNIPFVYYTATYTEPEDEKLGLSLGADRFLIKPIEPVTLVQIIREVFEEYSAKKATIAPKLTIEEAAYYQEYNEALFRKLEDKMAQLEEMNQQLLKSQLKLTQAQRIARLGNWEWDSINDTVILSDEIYQIFGLEPLKTTFEGFLEWVHPGDKEFVQRSIQEALTNHKILRIDHRVILLDGTQRVVYQQAEVIFNETGQAVGMMGVIQDITERRQLEDQLRQAQKMEAIGRLAGGVAHDFNNLLTIIMSSSEFLLEHYPDNNELSRDIQQIRKASERAAALTRQLLAFSRQQILQSKALNLNGVITDLEKMLRRLIGEDIDLVVVLDKELGWIKADQGQIEQVIMNLVVNARDAMPQGGGLIIETANIYLDEEYTYLHMDVAPGPYVMLTVSDTGRGIPPDIRDHIFEPFFTTKEVGRGTGLGLATVHGIVKQSDGHIWVYSEPNKGSTFRIYLPQIKRIGVELDQQRQAEIVTLSGSETILLVEDDELVRKLIHKILTGYGYTILEASSGHEALSICQDYTGVIHLLLTDIIMPGGMNGRELAEQIILLFPQIKVLYISGYSGEVITRHSNLVSNMPFISKPFSPTMLGKKVREVVDGLADR